MDNFTKELQEIIELKQIVDAYKSYISGKGKVPIQELYLDEKLKKTLMSVLEEEKGFLIKNNDISLDEKNFDIDAGDLFQIIEKFKEMGFETEYIFSKNLNEMFIKVKKVKEPGSSLGGFE
ncbi:hypothetical protein OSSY52_17270 [Tepiditoga spiralis]|uniref:Uncharacterized protein n=1 Tax=Tepiditoga spiralis TaxID=2108365 RepID=A0A7G1G860_9BACT|nr:hypothetical protein [Tepiditoga spiralis]BBE31586.1 hypothetical protein OSSY52_17270 [Tepiditoga spiralis]